MDAKRPIQIDLLIALIFVLAFSLNQCPLIAQEDITMFGEDFLSESTIQESEFYNPQNAAFDNWESVFENPTEVCPEEQSLLPYDWVRHFGFRHSSSHGRHVGKGIPMEGTSWQNRPYHINWFIGTLLSDELISGRVDQNNELIGGLRLGWDFDYYWGFEGRLAWSNPHLDVDGANTTPQNGRIFLSDVNLLYYPWGDSKIRPYGLLGLGLASFDFTDDLQVNHDATLVTLPIGAGFRFHHHSWLVWRLEAVDNIAFGADDISTQHNVSITAGMELRTGARPQSYWPWRSSRRIW